MSVSLVVEGGGMRGFYSMGVLSRMLDEGIRLPRVIAVSSGALAAARYLAGKTGVGFVRELGGTRDLLRPAGLVSPRGGLLRTSGFIDRAVPRDVLDAALCSGAHLEVSAVRARDAQLTWWASDDLASADELRERIVASCSIPVVMPIATVGGEVYVDGGIRDSIPIDRARDEGVTHHVALLTRPRLYRKGRQHLELYLRWWLRPYPALRRAMLERHLSYNSSMLLAKSEEDAGRAFVFRPGKTFMRRFEVNPEKFRVAYEAGRADCAARMPALVSFLDSATDAPALRGAAVDAGMRDSHGMRPVADGRKAAGGR
ncbi:MAG: patatin family protein [Coriobacteriales bacterium]|jgi:predicted patatin/cPLA2 family phospholipase